MARPKSDDKRNAILAAAIQEISEHGVSAPTSRIAKIAGVAEGSLFTYFSTKDELLNSLYLHLKEELREVMMSGYPRSESVKNRFKHAWQQYVGWGVTYPLKRRVLGKLGMSSRVSDYSKATGYQAFAEIVTMIQESTSNGLFRAYPPNFIAAILGTLAETTMDFIAKEPAQSEYFNNAGFEAFWNAIVTK